MYFKNIFDPEIENIARIKQHETVSTIHNLDKRYWKVEETPSGSIVRVIPLFNCNQLESNNKNDIVIQKKDGIICENKINTIITANTKEITQYYYDNLKIVVNNAGIGNTVERDSTVSCTIRVFDENNNEVTDFKEFELFLDGVYVRDVKTEFTVDVEETITIYVRLAFENGIFESNHLNLNVE